MATPNPRTKILLARGTKASLDASLADIAEGEVVYATDEGQAYIKYGGVYVATSVASVNSQTGTVVLTAADVGAATTAQGALADTAVQRAGDTMTGALGTTERTITAGAFDLATGNHWTCGAITVPAPTNATAGTSGLIRITAGPVVWNAVFKFPGGTAPTIASFPAIIPFYVESSSVILMGNVAEGIA